MTDTIDDEMSPRDLAAVDIHAMSEADYRAFVAAQFAAGRARMDSMESAIESNTSMTKATREDTEVIREVVEMARSFFRGLAKVSAFCARTWVWLSPVIRAISVLAGAATAVKVAYITYRGGNPPPPRSH
jgi:hypothetical protein